MMKTNKKKEKSVILLLIVAIVLMAVGFAAYSTTLTINGNVTVKPTKWSVHYGTLAATSGSVTEGTTASIDETQTKFTFNVTLNKPGDFYEATLPVVNDGSFDAKLTEVTMSTLTAAQQKYLKYTIAYNDGTPYTATTTGLNIELKAGATKNAVVRVEYLQPDSSSDLPQQAVTVEVSGSLKYDQVESGS